MWYSIPSADLSAGRRLDLVPEPDTVVTDAYNVDATGALVERFPTICGAFHAQFDAQASTPFTAAEIHLGSRYSLQLRRQPFTDGFNGDTVVLGRDSGSFTYWEIAFRDNGSDVLTVKCPLVLASAALVIDSINRGGGVNVGFGYALGSEGPFAYGFCINAFTGGNNNTIGPDAEVADQTCHFGNRSYFFRQAVDESDIYGTLRITGTRVRFSCAAAHDGPLTSHAIYKPDSEQEKRSRQGTITASLRSRALNFGQPLNQGRQTAPAYRLPVIDWGEPDPNDAQDLVAARQPRRFLCAYGSHIGHSVAFVRPDVAWNSNLSADHLQNERLARLRVTLTDQTSFVISQNIYALPETVWDATSEGQGNNEYVAYRSDPMTAFRVSGFGPSEKTFPRQNVFASLGLREEFAGPRFSVSPWSGPETFEEIELVPRYEAVVTIFLRDDSFSGEAAIRRFEIRKVLTQQEGQSLLAGQVVDLGSQPGGQGGITIQGIGPS